jgi:isoquinoline 1-oxidoreductase alpha subunit
MIEIKIDGATRVIEAPDDKPLLWVLREDVGMTGTKYGCGMGLCGACTVLVEGRATRSCVTPVSAVRGANIQTIETLNDQLGQAIKNAWCDGNVAQCGYCQPGQIVATYGLLSDREKGTPLNLKQSLTNICRCGTYGRIHRAVEKVAEDLDRGE